MSHITKVKTKLKDDQVLRRSLAKMGYNIIEAGQSYGRISGTIKDIEFVASKTGERLAFKRVSGDDCYEIFADWQEIRRGQQDIVNGITQVYSQEKIIDMAYSRGYSVITNRTNNKGQIEMVLRKVA
jgi:predicted regulator of amino acid metabolism with ACT domain